MKSSQTTDPLERATKIGGQSSQQSAPSEKRTCGGPTRYSNPSGPSVGMRGCQREIRPMPREIVALYVVDYLMAAARALMCRARCTRVQE